MSFYFDEDLSDKVDIFALHLVHEYRRYIAGEGYSNEETGKLFGCSVFANYLAKCNYEQKLLQKKGIPINKSKCDKQRHHVILCTGTVYCNNTADLLISCVKKNNISSVEETNQHCSQQFKAFKSCYIDRINKEYPTILEARKQ